MARSLVKYRAKTEKSTLMANVESATNLEMWLEAQKHPEETHSGRKRP